MKLVTPIPQGRRRTVIEPRGPVVRAALIVSMVLAPASLLAHTPPSRPMEASILAPSASEAAATVDAFHAALRRGDTRSAAALLDDKVLVFESGEVERSKAEYAAHHLGADIEFAKAVPSIVTGRAGQSFGTMAWIASEGRTTGNFNGRSIDVATTETMVLKRVGKTWRIVQIHWSSAKAR